MAIHSILSTLIDFIKSWRVLLFSTLALVFSFSIEASPRRGNIDARWKEPFQTEIAQKNSLQSHAGPLMFATVNSASFHHPDVRKELQKRLRNDSLQALAGSILQGDIYRDFIVSQLEDRRLPAELITVAYIESAFDVRAESRTGARGLWQFAENSMSPWLEKSTSGFIWDQRFDFWKSTAAAAEKLLYNHRETGSWELAIAAYNGGLNRILRSINASSGDFWKLEIGNGRSQISEQTASYLPKYAASNLLHQYPGRFGLPMDWNSPVYWNRIPIDESAPLTELAEKSGIPLAVLMAGNAEYISGYLPPGNHFLKFPIRYSANAKRLSEIYSDNSKYHLIQPGETLWSISKKYGIKVAVLMSINGLAPGEVLKSGDRLRIRPRTADTL